MQIFMFHYIQVKVSSPSRLNELHASLEMQIIVSFSDLLDL